MQRLFSSHRLCSSVVSFPSLPSLLVKSSLEPDEDWLLVALDEPEVLAELGELLVLAGPDLGGVASRVGGLGGGQGRLALRHTRDLIFMLPIVRIDHLTKGLQPIQSQGFPDLSNLVLEAIWSRIGDGVRHLHSPGPAM